MSNSSIDDLLKSALTSWKSALLDDPCTSSVYGDQSYSSNQQLGNSTDIVRNAVQHLDDCLKAAGVPVTIASSVMAVASTLHSIHCATQQPQLGVPELGPSSSSQELVEDAAPRQQLLKLHVGIPVNKTALGRRASASYKLYERLGGWETLSAAVDGVYNRLVTDPRVEWLQPPNEQELKAHMLEFLTASCGGERKRCESPRLWLSHQATVLRLGLPANYFDVMVEHLKATLEELNLPKEDVDSAITTLRTTRVHYEAAARTGLHGYFSSDGTGTLLQRSNTQQPALRNFAVFAGAAAGRGPPSV
mmetsp:Transcript_29879/g.66088  ORF Transcript_29879/g.66088 Transcript_29879/m.66088 type:complete len:305 (-) Transcript_29879:1379-2293(-)|eukprot:CAMPEP_0202892598 /NCGR_PEP_ID=MMETSP1392-20130828/2309_1 /ASSEMBLY_ACC=CAM_ASM_000868 /TAXON_ID=225041 /ORGANISM="Chlamydomonas chlamydogama, Strain SAG 11-48b" /LENGTH=304 /DNA_ID=CAMNT_0049576613 /DNA_START=62 /DNA_END=976 /DNA_ORIENTATION=+